MTIESSYGFTLWAVPRFHRPIAFAHQPALPRQARAPDHSPKDATALTSIAPALLENAAANDGLGAKH